jgi:hypothetical protein
MAIEFVCPTCGATLRVSDEAAGRDIRCGRCQEILKAPLPEADVPYAEAVAPEPSSAPSQAEPVAPPHEPRPRSYAWPVAPRKRRPWLLISVLVLGFFIFLCCGGVYLGGRPTWRTHHSVAGGFRVELPAAPKANLARWAGIQNDPRVNVEGTILLMRLEDYGVVYVDIDPFKRAQLTDDAIIQEAITGMKEATPGARVLRSDPVTVSGFPGREVVVDAPGEGVAVGRVVVAETRLYIAITGGRFADPGGERARRFLDSFEITDAQLIALHKQREDEARRKEEQARAARKKQDDILAAFEEGPHAGPPVPDPAALRGLVLYLPFDDPDPTIDRVSGKSVARLGDGARRAPGVRGRGVLLNTDAGRPQEDPFEVMRRGGEVIMKADTATRVDLSAAAAALRFKPTTPFTVCVWFKNRTDGHILYGGDAAEHPSTRLSFQLGWGEARTELQSAGALALSPKQRDGDGMKVNAGGAGLTDQRWHHFALVRRLSPKGETVEVYLDGRPAGTREGPAPVDLTGLTQLLLGGPPPKRERFGEKECACGVDEFCAFDRALSAAEVEYLVGHKPLPAGGFPADPSEWRPPPENVAYRLTPGPRLGPVSAAVFDPKRKAVWVVAPGDDGYPFWLRRHSATDFRVEAVYRLPGRVYCATFDAVNDRLYLAIDEGPDPGPGVVGRWRRYPATLCRFDLGALPPGPPADPPEVKPVASGWPPGKVAGIQATADGQKVYVLYEGPDNFYIYWADPNCQHGQQTALAGPDMTTPRMVDYNDPTGVGVRLVARRPPQAYVFGGPYTHSQWDVGGPVDDWAVTPDKRVFVVRDGKLWQYEIGHSDPWDRDRPPPEPVADPRAAHLGAALNRALVFAAGDAGVTAYRIDANRMRKADWPAAAALRATAAAPASGAFWVSPDEQFLLFASGQVVWVDDGTLARPAPPPEYVPPAHARGIPVAPPPRSAGSTLQAAPGEARGYTGRPVPAATEFPGLKVYLACDEFDGRATPEGVSKAVVRADLAKQIDGVRGRGLRVWNQLADPGLDLTAHREAIAAAGGGAFTIAVWVRVPDPQIGQVSVWDTKDWRTGTTHGRLSFRAGTVSLTLLSSSNSSATVEAKTPPAGEWCHLAVTRDEKGEVRLVVNGEPARGPRQELSAGLPFRAFGLVRNVNPMRTALDLDEFCVFDRALAADELRRLAGAAPMPGDLDRAPPKVATPAPKTPAEPPPADMAKGQQRYSGGPVPPASDFPGLKFYLDFDASDGKTVREAVSKADIKAGVAEPTDGVRGKALRVTHQKDQTYTGLDLTDQRDTFRVAAGRPFTMAAWVRLPSRVPSVTVWTSEGREQSSLLFTLRVGAGTASGSGSASLALTNVADRTTPGKRSYVRTAAKTPPVGEWFHLAVTRDEKGEIRLAVNGRPDDGPRQVITSEMVFGHFGLVRTTGTRPVAIDVDEFCLFDRALSGDELLRLAGREAEAKAKAPAAPATPAPARPDPPGNPPPLAVAKNKDVAAYSGPAVPAASDFPGLKVYLACDELAGGALTESVGKKPAGTVDAGELVDGVRGKALRLSHDRRTRPGKQAADLSDLKDAFRIPANGPFTLAVWVRPVDINTRSTTMVLKADVQDRTNPRWMSLGVLPGSASAMFGELPRGAGPKDALGARFYEPKTPPVGAWCHHAVVRDDKGEVRYFVNGVESTAVLAKPQTFAGELRYDVLGLVQSPDGKVVIDVDELCLFDRALSAEELKKLAGRP